MICGDVTRESQSLPISTLDSMCIDGRMIRRDPKQKRLRKDADYVLVTEKQKERDEIGGRILIYR